MLFMLPGGLRTADGMEIVHRTPHGQKGTKTFSITENNKISRNSPELMEMSELLAAKTNMYIYHLRVVCLIQAGPTQLKTDIRQPNAELNKQINTREIAGSLDSFSTKRYLQHKLKSNVT